MSEPIIIDTSLFDSGTFFRTCLAFASLAQKAIVMEKIFLENKFPGLDAQKSALVDIFAKATRADVAGNGVGSTVLQFTPNSPFLAKNVSLEFSSSSNVSLPLHALMIPALLASNKTSINITGGTHVDNAPTTSFIKETLLRYLSVYFDSISLTTSPVGFYPDGNGTVSFISNSRVSLGEKVKPLVVPINKSLVAIKGELISSSERLSSDALKSIKSLISLSLKKLDVPLILQPIYVPASSTGVSLTMVALFGNKDGFDSTFPHIVALDKTWSSLSSIDYSVLEDDCMAFVSDFSKLIDFKIIDIPSAELILPFIAVLGGSISVPKFTKNMEAIINASKLILNIDFDIDDNKATLSTKGYINTFYDSMPSIEDL